MREENERRILLDLADQAKEHAAFVAGREIPNHGPKTCRWCREREEIEREIEAKYR